MRCLSEGAQVCELEAVFWLNPQRKHETESAVCEKSVWFEYLNLNARKKTSLWRASGLQEPAIIPMSA